MPCKDAEAQRSAQRRSYAAKKQYIRDHLTQCVDCGNDNPVVLQFHHRDQDQMEFRLGHFSSQSYARIDAEISKCDVLCANCHLIRHSLAP